MTNPEPMPDQQIFDTVARHLMQQRVKSMDLNEEGEEYCKYRDSAGNKCAVGCLIPNHSYDPNMEGHTVRKLISLFPLALPHPINISLLEALQSAHDSHILDNGLSFWVPKMRSIAEDFRLDPSILEQWNQDDASENH